LIQGAHILCAPVLDTEGVMNDPHNAARDSLQAVEQPGAGTLRMPRAPFHFSAAAVEIRGRAPMMGEDNERVLGEVLHYPKERIDELTRGGVLYKRPNQGNA